MKNIKTVINKIKVHIKSDVEGPDEIVTKAVETPGAPNI
jgi:hypothetical protein